MPDLKDFGLWTRRLLAVAIVAYFGYMVVQGQMTAQDVKEVALLVIGFYFAKGE